MLFNYIKGISKEGKAEASINRSVVAIKMFLRFCRMMGHIEDDLTSMLESPLFHALEKLPENCAASLSERSGASDGPIGADR